MNNRQRSLYSVVGPGWKKTRNQGKRNTIRWSGYSSGWASSPT